MEGEQAIIRKGESSGKKPEDFGKMEHGCKHYKRRCQIRAPCCDKIFPCRHCHNEYTNNLENPQERHRIVRTQVKQVICSICDTEQQVARVCSQCGVNMGEYFCDICKFYNDDTGKGQFHCNHCGICRLGGQENYFHCKKCDACYAIGLRDNHICWAGVMRNKCPVCKEELFDSLESSLVLKCGHTMHVRCGEEMVKSARYACPVCNKSMVDMSVAWAELDKMIAKIQMPLSLRYKVWVLCNDCSESSEVNYHSVGMKCSNCNSYNTSNTSATPKELPQ